MSKGLEAVRDHIRQSFLEVHNDRRSREERVADQKLHSVEQSPVAKNHSSEKRINAFISAALRSEHIRRHIPQREHRWLIEEPAESADAVIAQVVRHLEQR